MRGHGSWCKLVEIAPSVQIILLLLAGTGCWCGKGSDDHPSERQATMYYVAAITTDGKRLAYVKRLSSYRVFPSTGPIFGGRGRIEFSVDRLLVCTSKRDLTDEDCMYSWALPLGKVPEIEPGQVRASIDWQQDKVVYWICILDFAGTIPASRSCLVPGGDRGSLLSNTESDGLLTPRTTASGWRVRIDSKPGFVSLPINNAIIVEPVEE